MDDLIYLAALNKHISKKQILDTFGYGSEDLIYVGGSLIEGLGNNYSDLDVFVLTKDLNNHDITADYKFSSTKVAFSRIEGINCDIEYWPLPVIEDLFTQFNQMDFSDTSVRVVNQLSIDTSADQLVSTVNRLINGVAIYNEEKVTQLIQSLKIEHFYRWMVRYYVNCVDNSFDDIIGNLEAGQYEVSVMVAREMCLALIRAYLYSKEIAIDRDKWIYPKLAKLAETDSQAKKVLKDFTYLYFQFPLQEKEDYKNNVETMVRFSHKIIQMIEQNLGGL